MSKFYYSGSIQQVNELKTKDIFLSLLFGNWIIMFIEGCLGLFFSIATFVLFFFFNHYYNIIPQFFYLSLSGLFLLLAVIDFFVRKFSIKNNNSLLIKIKMITFLVCAILSFLLEGVFLNLVFGLTAFSLLSYGFSTYRLNKFKNNNKRYLGIASIILAIFFFSLSFFSQNVKELCFAFILGIIGLIVIYYSLKFRKSIKQYTDEQEGFTDYEIE